MNYLDYAKTEHFDPHKDAQIAASIAIAEQAARLADAAERIADALEYKPFHFPAALAQQAKEQMQSDCTCAHHRKGESTSGWHCPVHGQMF